MEQVEGGDQRLSKQKRGAAVGLEQVAQLLGLQAGGPAQQVEQLLGLQKKP